MCVLPVYLMKTEKRTLKLTVEYQNKRWASAKVQQMLKFFPYQM